MMPVPTQAPAFAQALNDLGPFGGQAAVVTADRVITFAALADAAYSTAAGLGACPGQVIGVPARSTAGFFADVLGVWLAGGVPFPVDPKLPAGDVDRLIGQAGPTHTCRPWKVVVCVTGGVYRPLITGGELPLAPRKAQALGLGASPGQQATALFASPMHLNGPFEFAVRHLLAGGTVALLPSFSPSEWVQAAVRSQACWAFVVPTHLHRLLEQTPGPDLAVAVSSLRTLLHTSAPLSPGLHDRFEALTGPGVLTGYYGAAEYDGTVTRAGTTRTLPGAHLRVVDDTGTRVPAGVTGRIEGCNHVRLGHHYAGEPCGTAHEWRTVGDHGVASDDGTVTVTDVTAPGRAIIGGINVAVNRTRDLLASHPAVTGCTVSTVPDTVYGQRLTACVTTNGPVSEQDLLGLCAAALRPAERPIRVVLAPAGREHANAVHV